MATDAHAVPVPAAMGGTAQDPAARMADLFDVHHPRLFRLARRLARNPDDAADLVQETFLRAARAPDRVPRGRTSEEAWLVRVMINVCRDGWRQSAVRQRAVVSGRVAAPGASNPEPGLLAHVMVWQALERLPPRRRAILVLYELEGTPIADIARLTGVTPVTVRWHLMRARREMMCVLGDKR